MVVPVKVVAHPKTCVTNHGLIKLIIMDDLECQVWSWEDFMSRKMRNSHQRQAETLIDTPKEARVTKERGKSS